MNKKFDCSTVKSESYAQWGDDVLVWEFFGGKTGVFFEAGANDPIALSQTYLLEKRGWVGILVDPVPSCCDALRRDRPCSKVFQNALGGPQHHGKLRLRVPDGCTELAHAVPDEELANYDSEIAAAALSGERRQSDSVTDTFIEADFITINEALKQSGFDRIDYLSLDLEGFELPALQGLDFQRIRPRLVIIEDRFDNLIRHRYMIRQDYKIVKINGSNSWYVPRETEFPVALAMRVELLRKLYLSMPFRYFRDTMRRLRNN